MARTCNVADVWSRLVHGARVSWSVGLVRERRPHHRRHARLIAGSYARWLTRSPWSGRLTPPSYASPAIAISLRCNRRLGFVFITSSSFVWASIARLVRGPVLVPLSANRVHQSIRALVAGDRRSHPQSPWRGSARGHRVTLGVSARSWPKPLCHLGLGVQPPTPSLGAMVA